MKAVPRLFSLVTCSMHIFVTLAFSLPYYGTSTYEKCSLLGHTEIKSALSYDVVYADLRYFLADKQGHT